MKLLKERQYDRATRIYCNGVNISAVYRYLYYLDIILVWRITMRVNTKEYKIIEVLGLDSKLYSYNATCNHPLLVAMRHFVTKTKSKHLIVKGKITPGNIILLLKAIKEYRAQFEGRSLKHGIMQEKLLQKLEAFANKNLLK